MPAFNFQVDELDDSPQELIDDRGLTATRTFLLPWANRYEFAAGMIARPWFGLYLPEKYPGFDLVRVKSIALQPFTDRPDFQVMVDPAYVLNTYSTGACLARVEYNTVQAVQPDGTDLNYRVEFSGEFFSVPSRAMKWAEDDVPVSPDALGTLLIPMTTHVLTWSRVRRPPWQAISELRGKVNDAQVSIALTGQTAEAETLLFEGATADVQMNPLSDAEPTWRLEYRFREKAIHVLGGEDGAVNPAGAEVVGWNHFYRDTGTPGWYKPAANGSPAYSSGDLTRLFDADSEQ